MERRETEGLRDKPGELGNRETHIYWNTKIEILVNEKTERQNQRETEG